VEIMANYDLFGSSLVGVFEQAIDGRLVDCNDACAHMLGYDSRDQLLSVGAFDHFNPTDFDTIVAALADLGTISNLEISLRRRNGTPAWVLETMTLEAADGARPATIHGVMFDVTEQRSGTQRLEYQAYHDTLTLLPNRMLFVDRLGVALSISKRRGTPLYVMLLDLDHFELMNSTFGQAFSDRLLRQVADRLNDCVREEDSLARYGSDEFIIMMTDRANENEVAALAHRLLQTLSLPFLLDGHEVSIFGTIGISSFPDDGIEAEDLVKAAGDAMFHAKAQGRNTFEFHQPQASARALERASLVAGLRRALISHELELHYQPQVNVQSGRIECIEALLRWRHPDLGLVNAADFLPAAEEGNLSVPISEWVMGEACRQARAWQDSGMRDMRVAINLSSRQFHSRGLERTLDRCVSAAGIDPGSLELEISELSLGDSDTSIQIFQSLHNFGVRLAIDDFGTGHSSMTDLKRMPIDTLKIAPAFVHNVTSRHDDAAIVQAMITMARGLDLRIVAEGVESKEQLAHLLDHRCVDMQGYFLGKPLPAAQWEETLGMQH
jgi:diguanylate cyclase (GGDEF)-like protein